VDITILLRWVNDVVAGFDFMREPKKLSNLQDIREAFGAASESKLFKLKQWYLCTPSRPTKEDIRWFDTWKGKQLADPGNQSLKEIDRASIQP